MRHPVLVAVVDENEQWEDPSEDLLLILLQDLVAGRTRRLRIDRIDESGHSFEITRNNKTFRILRRRDDRVMEADSEDVREVHAACVRWAFRIDSGTALMGRGQWGGFDGTLDWRIVRNITDLNPGDTRPSAPASVSGRQAQK